MLKCNKNLKVIWVSWMHSTWNEECISHASGQAGVAMAPGMKGRKSQKRRRHKDEPPNLWTNFSNSCLAPELHVFGRCQHAPGGKQHPNSLKLVMQITWASQVAQQWSACLQCGRPGFNPWDASPGEGNDNPLQYSCLGNHMDRGAWWNTVHGATKSQTRLSD